MENIENRSEELAKLLDIKPKYLISYRYHQWEDEFVDTIEEAERRPEYFYEDKHDKYKVIYPNFYKPGNFVRPMELSDILINSAEFESWTQKDYIGYNFGPSSWMPSVVLAYENGSTQTINIIEHDGEYSWKI